MLLYSVIGLCACSAKVNEDNQNTNPQERYTKEDKTERVSTDEGKESSIENKNEKTEDSSTDDLGSLCLGRYSCRKSNHTRSII